MRSRSVRTLVVAFALLAAFATLSLAGMADGANKFVGNVLGPKKATSGDYSLFTPSDFLTYWNQVTPENDGKWGYLETSRDGFDSNAVDRLKAIYKYSKDNHIPFKFHALIWGRPDQDESTWRKNLSAADMRAEVEEWFNWVNTNFPEIDYIDVVNEALNEDLSYKAAFQGQVPGYTGDANLEWVAWSFLKARQIFPARTKLLINDFQVENGQQTAKYKALIDNLLTYQYNSRPIIDGIGMQCHTFNIVESGGEKAGVIQASLDTLAATGLPLYVTELDIAPTTSETQLKAYQRVLPILWEHPSVVGVTFWGYSIGRTWKDGTGLVDHDKSGNPPNEAMKWIVQYFKDNPNPPNDFAVDMDLLPGSTFIGAGDGVASGGVYETGDNRGYYTAATKASFTAVYPELYTEILFGNRNGNEIDVELRQTIAITVPGKSGGRVTYKMPAPPFIGKATISGNMLTVVNPEMWDVALKYFVITMADANSLAFSYEFDVDNAYSGFGVLTRDGIPPDPQQMVIMIDDVKPQDAPIVAIPKIGNGSKSVTVSAKTSAINVESGEWNGVVQLQFTNPNPPTEKQIEVVLIDDVGNQKVYDFKAADSNPGYYGWGGQIQFPKAGKRYNMLIKRIAPNPVTFTLRAW